MTTKGHIALSLSSSVAGHLRLKAYLGQASATLLLDTGASNTLIDKSFALKANIPLKRTSELGLSFGKTTTEIYKMAPQQLLLENFEAVDLEVFAMDLSRTNNVLSSQGELPFDGVLGADFLSKYAAVIEYETLTLYVKPLHQ